MAKVKTFVRPMAGWWRKNPYFVRYMIRESSSVFLAIYAVILLVGLLRLTQGEAAYDAWRAALMSPVSILFHWLRCDGRLSRLYVVDGVTQDRTGHRIAGRLHPRRSPAAACWG
jgi:fumarate reductase subunit C